MGGGPQVKDAPARPKRVVLDYRNGWQHPSDGKQSVAEIAQTYEREPELLAQLNSLSVNDIPAAGLRLYVPPTDDPERLREVLTRIQGKPHLVPDRPWRHKPARPLKSRVAAAPKTADQATKVKPKAREKPIFSLPMTPYETASATAAKLKKPDPLKLKVPETSDGGAGNNRRSRSSQGSGPRFLWPIRGDVRTKFREGWNKACHGIEITPKAGEREVRAARSGKVLLAQDFISYGNLVVIDHGDGFATAYGYNRDVWVKEGDVVKRGQQIARAGSPYKNGKPLVFFQIRRNARPVDPMDYLY